MKKYLVPVVAAALLMGGAFAGGALATDALYADAYADGRDEATAEIAASSAERLPDQESKLPSGDDPIDAAQYVWKLWQGARVPAIIAGFFLLGMFVHRRGWLKGRWAFYLSTSLAAVAVIAERAAQGDTPGVAMVASALGTIFVAVMKFEFGDKSEAAK